jgi:transcriptional regulator with XRE-family HTH domain
MGVSLEELGGRLRSLRREKKLSLGVVARGTGLSASFLSLVETGKSDISLGRLVRLMDFYEVTLGGLVGPCEQRAAGMVRRAEERYRLDSPGGVRTELLADPLNALIAHLLMTFEPAGSIELDDDDKFWSNRSGESFYLVLQGELLVELVDREAVVLTEGDSISLVREDFRRCRNVCSRPTVVYIARMYSPSLEGGDARAGDSPGRAEFYD